MEFRNQFYHIKLVLEISLTLIMKAWFTDDNNKIYFKKNWSRVFNRWKKSNSTEANKFLDDMKNIMKH